MKIKKIYGVIFALLSLQAVTGQELYTAPAKHTTTRWASPENPTAEKGKGGLTNKGAKGNAFYIVAPNETKTILNIKGSGIIRRMWMTGSIAKNAEQRRAVIINMYWDDSKKPAVSVPIGDFFGAGLGFMVPFDSELFSNPEGRSFNSTIPMPYRTAAKIEIVNESSSQVLFWYDINFTSMSSIPKDAMYFHAYWSRDFKTKLGQDFAVLPKVKGKGRYLGTNIGVIGNEAYQGTWFGEGEVKIYLDGDSTHPSLVGTGTEDYIGIGWGQDIFDARRFGSLVSNPTLDLYAFYRYHTADPVFFHNDCKVTIQQIGNTGSKEKLKQIQDRGGELIPVWQLQSYRNAPRNSKGKLMKHIRLLDNPDEEKEIIDNTSSNFYRRDDVSATAYFYLDRPENNLPSIAPVETRLKYMKDIWDKTQTQY